MSKVTFETLSARIALIAASEKVTKQEMGLLSREVLTYILESEDVRPINNLLGKDKEGNYLLTRNNRVVAGMYFSEFVPFNTNGAKVSEGEQLIFVKKKARVYDKYVAKINDWLGVGTNDIWSWAADNVQVEAKPKEYAGNIEKLVKKALADEVEGITKVDVLKAVMSAGISIEDLLFIAGMEEQAEQAA